MRNRVLLTTVAGILSLFGSITPSAIAQNRLPQAIPAESARVPIAKTVNPRAQAATDLGIAPAGQTLESLTLRFNMTPAQSAALDQLLANQQNPSSPQYRQWLTPAQFGARFGLGAADLATVANWLQSQGFTVTGVANGRQFVTFSGTVGQVDQAFGVEIHTLSYRGERHFSNLTDPVLPAALAGVVQTITGLNDFHPRSRAIRRTVAADPKFNGTAASYGNLIAPGDFYTIYDENKLLTASTPINGSGVTIGVMGQVDVFSSDIASFRTAAGLSANAFTQVSEGTTPAALNGATCANPATQSIAQTCGDIQESSLDLEWSGAVAPSANILFVTGPHVFANAMTQAIDQNLAPILTVSYGDCEANWGAGNIAAFNALFKQANAQGQTVFGPAGDDGAADCDGDDDPATTFASQGLSVDFPASSPYVTAVGGTQFADAGGTYWGTANGTNGGTALSYIPEQPWNEFYQSYPSQNIALTGLIDGGGGGGGVSSVFSKPSWQTGTGVPADASRDVPDVAYAAAANHDGYLFCVFGSCANGGFSDTTTTGAGATVTSYEVAGGTSFATPEFAATLALLEQKNGGTRLGNINPNIYGLAASSYDSSVFHQKNSGGTNAAPCVPGSVDCVAGYPGYFAAGTITCPANSCSGDIAYPAIGYLGGSGYSYDLASGWGSVDIANFVADFALATPTTVSTSGNTPSSVTVATTTPSITAGATVTVTATVASGVSTVTATPTGTVQLLVDNAPEGSAVSLSGGTATLPAYTTPTTIASGTHTFAVSYSGDANYAGSIGAVSVDVTAPSGGTQDFSITPATATVTVASGGTTTGTTYTVTSLNGFSGVVSFSASTTSTTLNDDAAISFSNTSVSVTSTTPGTTVFTLYAYYNATTGYAKHGQLKLAANHLPPSPAPWQLAGSGVAIAGLILVGLPRRRRNRWSALMVAILSVGILSVAGCSGASGPAGSNNGNINVPAGTYTVTVTATGTNASGTALSHSATINLTVQ